MAQRRKGKRPHWGWLLSPKREGTAPAQLCPTSCGDQDEMQDVYTDHSLEKDRRDGFCSEMLANEQILN